MSLPETCPFCGSGSDMRNGEKWIGFTCITTIHSGHDGRRLQSVTCAGLERQRIAARLAELEAENKALRERNAKLECCVDAAWGIIANAGGGDWNTQTPEWKEAAESWRDNQFHPIIKDVAAVNAKAEGGMR